MQGLSKAVLSLETLEVWVLSHRHILCCASPSMDTDHWVSTSEKETTKKTVFSAHAYLMYIAKYNMALFYMGFVLHTTQNT